MLYDILLEKKASKIGEIVSWGKDSIEAAAKSPRTTLEHIDREMLGSRFTDYKKWLGGNKGTSLLSKALPYAGAGAAGLSLVGAYDIMDNKKYDYSFNDVYWGLTGLPTYAAFRGYRKIRNKINEHE